MKILISIVFLVFTQNAIAGEIFIAHGTSSVPTPYKETSATIDLVLESSVANAKKSLPHQNYVQTSPWKKSWFHSGSRIYGNARAAFKSLQESAPWFVTPPATSLSLLKSETTDDEVKEALQKSKAEVQNRAQFYCGTDADLIGDWNEVTQETPSSYIIQVSGKFECK